jgi:hypothetical protein
MDVSMKGIKNEQDLLNPLPGNYNVEIAINTLSAKVLRFRIVNTCGDDLI